jgi:hypothetical protein
VTAAVTYGIQLLRTRLKADQYQLLQDIAYTAVHAAEQSALNGVIDDKKSYAFNVAAEALSKAGVKVSGEQLSNAIEAAVSEAFNAGRETPTTTAGAEVL